jgi:hypothetical protein
LNGSPEEREAPASPSADDQLVFERLRPSLFARHRGRFALLQFGKLVGVFDREDEACKAGLNTCVPGPISVCKI